MERIWYFRTKIQFIEDLKNNIQNIVTSIIQQFFYSIRDESFLSRLKKGNPKDDDFHVLNQLKDDVDNAKAKLTKLEQRLREGFKKKRIFKDIGLKGGRGSSSKPNFFLVRN